MNNEEIKDFPVQTTFNDDDMSIEENEDMESE